MGDAEPDPIVDALAMRLRCVELVAWMQITSQAEQLGLSFEDLRLLLALSAASGASEVADLARLSGLSLDAAYPAVHRLRGRGHLREERRRYSLTEEGKKLVATLGAAHREGVREYVDGLDPGERLRLDEAIRHDQGVRQGTHGRAGLTEGASLRRSTNGAPP